jgi:tripartite-type tricarboxylate transporter receptor subunit TctC
MTFNFTRRVALALFIALPALATMAQTPDAKRDYPSGPVRIIVPFGSGGLTDILGRAIAQHLSARFGQSVVVENRTGASGNIGADLVAKSRPDGQTLLMGSIGTNAVNAHLFSKMPYDTLRDFSPVALVASGTLMLVTNAERVPATNLAELMTFARANPGSLTYASGGPGASQHLAGELFKSMAGIDIVHVPYRGIAPGVTDLVGGQVSMTFDLATVAPHIKSGKLRPIAVASGKRSAAFPEVPTMAEAGLPGYEASAWYGLFAPAGTPTAVISLLNAEVNRALASPELRRSLGNLGAEPLGGSAADATAFVSAEYKKWGTVVKAAKIKID